ncbi:MAG TPA: polysaccharide deacetylase family protein [Pseudonocardiaceae bacterium]|nr:polysaccharide deacetylase family protein [Pseudonocardiaceae bacterium]
MKRLSRRRVLGLAAQSATLAGAITTGLRGSAATALPVAITLPSTVTLPLAVTLPSAPARPPVRQVHGILPGAPDNLIALTIDDGPDPRWTPQVLDLLRLHGVQATFSLIGIRARAHPDLARRITADGHAICNHSMTHPQPFARRPAEAILQQITDAQSAIADAGGQKPTLFRAPGGSWSPVVLAAVASLRLVPLGWNIDPRDWSRPGAEMITRTLLAAQGGDILLCHDGGGDRRQTLEALRSVLPALTSRGLRFAAL